MLQYKLRVARTEGADAASRAEQASTSYDSTKQQYTEAQTAAQEAAATAAAEISTLQVGSHQPEDLYLMAMARSFHATHNRTDC